MTDLTLTPAELQGLTGLKQAKRITTWLTDRGWVFEAPRSRGKFPAVDRTYYLARMSGQGTTGRTTRLRLDRM